ncbi:unnamed protein product [Zymoseptoria tritici ST99CH_1E4]|uniref:Uncharacterized protein n=1 Tax=Zymoseptoria tritici ST99CH_1E4 TaxID=1276532 RepID=A0A2H1H0A0_ZYMTR|nr:unnamed protein product [Zymoseptoria tritici ST99CH_1E4]
MKRSFEELSVEVLGAQTSSDRRGKRGRVGDPEERPPIATWRCNLTALSQLHNLYFVASKEKIYVYEPQFPAQRLPPLPSLIVHCPPSRPGLPGCIDPRQPRCINYLVVQLLGNEEILAVTRDDGDVDAFLVKHVLSAIGRQVESQSSISILVDMKPFFQRNVGESAWGLAVHAEARIIAVSANTHAVTIFKFGLVDHQSGEEATSFEGRESDVTHRVLNGNTNIPYIAFCNTGDDPEGRWLLTTDISGHCCCIDIHTMQRSPRFSFGPARDIQTQFDRVNAGWLVMFLDRRSFVREATAEAALGMELDAISPDNPDGRDLWDISDTASLISNRAARFALRPRAYSPIGNVGSSQDQIDEDASLTESATELDDVEASVSGDVSMADDEDVDHDDSDSDSGDSQFYTGYEEDETDEEDAILPSFPPFGPVNDTLQALRSNGENPFGKTSCPILHTSFRSAYLLQPSQDKGCSISPPTVTFRDVLRQVVPHDHSMLNAFERLNMTAYIPSLGVVILASQKGRAVVLTLTKVKKSSKYPEHLQHSAYHTKTDYAMRVEHILPFAEQEKRGERPFMPLLGIAAGPMQGTEDLPAERQRWRFMMYYCDHSVLSYEISRSKGRDSSAAFETVVV